MALLQGIRQDAWSHEEDVLLAETVLRYIQEGKTQLTAFQEVGDQLSRTAAACGFRWNATLRKQYDEAIQKAKQNRKHIPYIAGEAGMAVQDKGQPAIHEVLESLERMQKYYHSLNEQQEVQKLLEQNKQLQQTITKYQDFHQTIKEAMKQLE